MEVVVSPPLAEMKGGEEEDGTKLNAPPSSSSASDMYSRHEVRYSEEILILYVNGYPFVQC